MSQTVDYPFADLPEPGETMEVAPGLYWVRMPLPLDLNHINLWLADDGDSWSVIDTGLNTREIQGLWQTVVDKTLGGKPIKRVYVTHLHPDHIGLAGWFTEKWDAEVAMSRSDWFLARLLTLSASEVPPEPVIEFHRQLGLPEDLVEVFRTAGYGNFAKGVYELPFGYRRIQDGDVEKFAGSDWRAMEGLGHAPEHICHYSAEKGVLIAGDQVLPRISPIIGVYPSEPDADPLTEYVTSLATFKSLPKDTLVLPAHGKPFYGLHERIDELIAHHDERCEILIEHCQTPMSVYETLPLLFKRPLKGQSIFMAMAEALAHAHKLINEGRMVRDIDAKGIFRYRTVMKTGAAA